MHNQSCWDIVKKIFVCNIQINSVMENIYCFSQSLTGEDGLLCVYHVNNSKIKMLIVFNIVENRKTLKSVRLIVFVFFEEKCGE